ncbi:urease accessory protein UreE [cf. Phormidesmis sp. LEGE 11477]|uniref:urease accessory protein UreE n=1 Tax=cf. Phormidesmis sp. LEGE 11477 TaxID=1828680 RepID=UPI00188265C3|nr:urease accessory protein UreE [cf. Phormidesmis sp. LEGE 11477]MBE9060384.1 urease accessory protein UreE [cf. Phormidesmis sp. LEGE 11477]
MTVETVLAETYLGNVGESDELAQRVLRSQKDGLCLEVTIGRSDRAKGRILVSTESGQQVGISKGRDWSLKEGDVLAAQEDRLVRVSIESQTVIALKIAESEHNDPAALIRLGHVLGNRHWPVVVQAHTLYIELAADAALIESTLKETVARLNIKGLRLEQVEKSAQETLDFHEDSHTDSTHHHH